MTRLALLLALLCAAPRLAAAHAFDPAVLELVERDGGAIDLAWRVPPALAARAGELLRPRLPDRCHVTARPAASTSRLDCGPDGARGLSLGVDGLDGAQAEVLVHAVLADGTEVAGSLHDTADRLDLRPRSNAGAPSAAAAASSATAVLGGYLRLGVRHILGGFDHLLFLVGLLLLVDKARALARTVTAFTLAHSVTLALAATGVVAPPQAPVEALIAASILLVALELARRGAGGASASPSLLSRSPALAALTFGLLHGFGFAGALAEAGLPADRAPLALLGFNVGVELGQLAVVALLLVPAGALRRRAALVEGARGAGPALLRWGPAYALGAVSSAWLLARTAAVFSTGRVG